MQFMTPARIFSKEVGSIVMFVLRTGLCLTGVALGLRLSGVELCGSIRCHFMSLGPLLQKLRMW